MSIDQIANGRMWTNDMSMNVWRPASSMEPSSATLDSSSIPDQLHLFPLPIPDNVEARPLTRDEKARIDMLGELQFFLATAPTRWNQADTLPMSNLSKFQLPNGEHVSCILWNGLYHITGTDIVRALAYRFEAFGRPIKHTKKWEEGVFSDLRNLKPGTDACLEEPKSPLLDFLFRNGCIRTQKKQKVFYWFSVPHDRLFLDALERDLKREKAGQEPTTAVAGEPARSFRYDPRRSLYEQFAGQNPGINQTLFSGSMHDYSSFSSSTSRPSPAVEIPQNGSSLQIPDYGGLRPDRHRHSPQPSASHFFSRTLFEGSPAYKRRRVRSRQGTSPSVIDENGIVQRRGSPMPESYTSDMRSVTTSPRLHPHVFRKVSGEHDLGRSSPALVKRERDSSSQLPDGPDGLNDDDRVYQCSFDFCQRKFKRLEHLKRHLRTHTQEKPFDCSKCARSFSRQDNLVQHLRTHEKAEEEEGYEVQEYRWATASPVGGGYPNHSNHRPFHNSISAPNMQMPPPSLPVVSRPSTVPPDWPSIAPPADLKIPYEDSPLAPSQMRRYRSATPSVITYNPVPMPPPPPTSWNGGYDYWIPTPSYDVGGLMPPPVGAGYGGEMIQLPYGVEAGGYDPPAGGA